MTIIEFFQHPSTTLPVEPKAGVSFRETLFDRLDKYLDLIKEVEFTGVSAVIPKAQLRIAINLVEGIKKSVVLYYQGHPFDAYDELKKVFDSSSILSALKSKKYAGKNHFFRLRENDSNFALPKEELFHIPFDKRERLGTQRYSIPGFPCLYISDSVYVAWEELRRPSLDKIQAIRLMNITPITYLDLSTDVYLGEGEILRGMDTDELWNYLLAWPMVAACSVKVRDSKNTFKPEYIIPQFLLQMVRKEGKLDGIRFSSTHVKRSSALTGTFYNLAIPVKEDCEKGHCNKIKMMFDMTDPIPWELSDTFSRSHGVYLFNRSEAPPSMAVKTISLYENRTIKYEDSTFGNLETALHDMPEHPLN